MKASLARSLVEVRKEPGKTVIYLIGDTGWDPQIFAGGPLEAREARKCITEKLDAYFAGVDGGLLEAARRIIAEVGVSKTGQDIRGPLTTRKSVSGVALQRLLKAVQAREKWERGE